MDIWRATKEQIIAIAEQKSGKKAVSVFKPSGLYAWVTMADNEVMTISENEL